ncbi:peptidoglycan bridge formation glycyltransferase FemA/FemB family protein [Candidatus Saccharibacteria bacterium]|nr:MAG: peptidoglycan bridge formation glycyltransferase FemA/FemB family protein [Candidatus Saccharibacteria bacterium]
MGVYTIQSCSVEDYEAASQSYLGRQQEPVSFLQAPLYGKLQTSSGKDVAYVRIMKQREIIGFGLGVVYHAPGGLTFLYCPYGPVSQEWQQELIIDLEAFFRPLADRLGCAFVRLDNDAVKQISVKKPIPGKIARTASLQPRAEWVLNISPDEETIWMGFHKHARYNVRLAERAGASIVVLKPRETPLETFYSLMKTTSERDGFGIFDKNYYGAYLKTLNDDEGFVVLVNIDGKPAAAGLFVVYDRQAHYVFAGSSNDFRKIAPAYTVIWTAVKEAKNVAAPSLTSAE